MNALLFVLGLAALVVGAELLVRGSRRIALSFGVSPLVVGLTLVAFGTSAPEVAVSVGSALRGHPELSVGNVVGSNVFNVLFILGTSALIVPLTVVRQVVRQEVPVMIGASALLLVQALDGRLSRWESGLLVLLLGAYTVFLVRQSRAAGREDAEAADPADAAVPRRGGGLRSALLVLVGLALLVLGSEWLVRAATSFAAALGVSDLVIGLTVVAAGTSLPEVATSITAAFRGERDIAIGNVVGSNTFNVLGCLGASGLASDGGLPVGRELLDFDLWVMLAVAVACVPVFLSGRRIARAEGALFLALYAAYTGYLLLSATESAWLPSARSALLSIVLPLTVVTLVVSLLRAPSNEPGSP